MVRIAEVSLISCILLTGMLSGCSTCSDAQPKAAAMATAKPVMKATTDDGTRLMLSAADVEAATANPHHTRHEQIFGKYVDGYNDEILKGVDKVQASAPDGGGYFVGIKADPPESPIGYDLALFNQPLLKAPRTTSYCSGSSYSAFIEGMDMILPEGGSRIDDTHLEAMRMQEPDGGRREDLVKFWGMWNADGFGSEFGLVQYGKMGREVTPDEARPGDFMNISWKSGNGHSVVFLGWYQDPDGVQKVMYWASQKGTNGLGDALVPLSKIQEVKIVRLTNPEGVYTFDPATEVNRKVKGDKVGW